MIAVLMIILSEGNKSNYESPYDAAVQAYSSAKVPMFGTRTTLWIVEAIKEHQAYRESALAYLRNTKDVSETN